MATDPCGTLARVAVWGRRAVASALFVGVLLKCVRDVSFTWDVWYYHLPFAARLAGILPASQYAFHPLNQARFDGFPLLAEALQGLLWRLTGAPEAANLLGFAALVAYVFFVKYAFRVPASLTWIALMGIPLVQMHASSAYIDLPANVALAALVLAVYRMYLAPPKQGFAPSPAAVTRPVFPCRLLAFSVACASIAANMRFQLNPTVLLVLLAAAPRALTSVLTAFRERLWLRAIALTLVAGACVAVVFATPLRNLVRFHNPAFPMRLAWFGRPLPFAEDVYSGFPPYLEHAPQPARFALSLAEYGVRPLTDSARWTVDQWAPAASAATRMGGFFGAYVLANLVALAVFTFAVKARRARVGAFTVVALTLTTAFLPQSHELRYYMHWMIVLVTMNLIVAHGPRGTGRARSERVAEVTTVAISVTAVASVVVVGLVTQGYFLRPSGYGFADLLRDKVDGRKLERIREGEAACFYVEPWTVLYAAPFHARHYLLQEGSSPAGCSPARFIH